jgi:hypothetical protein
MSRTQARLDSDLPYADGHIFIPILPNYVTTGAGAVATRPAAGLYGTSLPTTATAYTVMIPLGSLLFRSGVQDDLQEQFGSLVAGGAQGQPTPDQITYQIGSVVAGANVNVNVITSGNFSVGQVVIYDTVASGVQEFPTITAIPDGTHITFGTIKNSHSANAPITGNLFTTPAGITGRPPYTGVSQLTPVTAPRPKGISFEAIYAVYTIGTAAATVNTIGLTQAIFANGAAVPTATNIIANAANGLGTAFGATMYVTPIVVPAAQQFFRTTKLTEYVLEWDVTTGTGGNAVLYGVFFDVEYNYA